MLCPNCAAPLSDTAKFCSNCGSAIAPAANSPYATPEESNSPYQGQAYEAAAAAQPEQSPFERGYQQGYAWASGEQPPQAEPVNSSWQQQTYQQPASPFAQPAAPVYTPSAEKSKVVAGVLGILLGSLGIHKFYLNYSKEGVIMLVVTLVGSILTFGLAGAAMQVIGIIEGILYLVKTDEDFYITYVAGNKPWF